MINWIKELFNGAFKADISNQVIEKLAAQAEGYSGVDLAPATKPQITKEDLEKMTKDKIAEEAKTRGITIAKNKTKNQMIEEFIKTIKEK